MQREASCCCNQLSIIVSGDPEINALCSCNNCKQRTGSAFGISAYFNVNNIIQKLGNPKCYNLVSESQQNEQNRFFCNKCGTTLYWTVSTLPDLIGVAGGCFTDSPLPQPNISASSSNQNSWVKLPEHWDVQD